MAYRFKVGEPITAGVRRVANEQIDRAEQRLSEASGTAASVHETRKSLKRIRALLRLVKPGLGHKVFRRENARYRDIAHLLANERDQQVLADMAAALEARGGPAAAGLATIRAALAAQTVAAPEQGAATLERALALLRTARGAAHRLKIEGSGFEPVVQGLALSYRNCRSTYRAAYAEPSDEAFHEWRKCVQHHWRHMLLLSPAWPDYIGARARAARELSQILGRDHDLAMLTAFLASEQAPHLSARDAARVRALCRACQAETRAAARPHAERLLAEGPDGLVRRISVYWDAAQALDVAEEEPPAKAAHPKAKPKVKTADAENPGTGTA